jgi:hypothetical protein
LSPEPLIVLGVDGLDWRWIDGHRASMPRLAGWPQLRPLQSIFPPDSIPAWTTIFTGEAPGQHGALESIDYLDERPAAAAEDSARRLPGRCFWDDASRAGKRVAVVNPFLAYPAWDVNGIMISGPVFVEAGAVSMTGILEADIAPLPELGGIVSFPTPKTMGSFVEETLQATRAQAELGLKILGIGQPDLFFINILTVDRMKHFAWRFCDPDDPTWPGPNPHSDAIDRIYGLVDEIAGRYADHGRVVILSDHGHARRCTRMLYVDEVLRRAGLLDAARPLTSKAYWIEKAKRAALNTAFRTGTEAHAYRLARWLPNRKALKQSTFSSRPESAARLSRIFGRNQFGGIELPEDGPTVRAAVRRALEGVRDPASGEPVVDWIRDREDVVEGELSGRSSARCSRRTSITAGSRAGTRTSEYWPAPSRPSARPRRSPGLVTSSSRSSARGTPCESCKPTSSSIRAPAQRRPSSKRGSCFGAGATR